MFNRISKNAQWPQVIAGTLLRRRSPVGSGQLPNRSGSVKFAVIGVQ